jgi:hypothetical protein
MYVEILSTALDGWADRLSGAPLLDYVLSCRAVLPAPGRHGAYGALAAEVGYDRALIRLCAERGIAVGPEDFDVPAVERSRLEDRLAAVGVDLAALARQR